MRLSAHFEGLEGLVGKSDRHPLVGRFRPLVAADSPHMWTRQAAAAPGYSPSGWSPSAQEVLAR